MNQQIFQKHYTENLALLPQISQQAINSFDWVNILLDIGKSYALQLDELEDLQLETMMLIVGITPADEYEHQLSSALPLPKTDFEKLLGDINTRILEPIHDYIVNGGPVEKTIPSETADIVLMTGENSDQEIPTSPMRIEPLSVDDIDIMSEFSLAPVKRDDIIEHKLDDIFHETLEHVEHI